MERKSMVKNWSQTAQYDNQEHSMSKEVAKFSPNGFNNSRLKLTKCPQLQYGFSLHTASVSHFWHIEKSYVLYHLQVFAWVHNSEKIRLHFIIYVYIYVFMCGNNTPINITTLTFNIEITHTVILYLQVIHDSYYLFQILLFVPDYFFRWLWSRISLIWILTLPIFSYLCWFRKNVATLSSFFSRNSCYTALIKSNVFEKGACQNLKWPNSL